MTDRVGGFPEPDATATDAHGTATAAGRPGELEPLNRMLAMALERGDFDAAKRVLGEMEARRRDAASSVVDIRAKQGWR